MTKQEIDKFHTLLADYVRRHEDETLQSIGDKFGLSMAQVSVIARKHGINRGPDIRGNRVNLTPELIAELEK